MRLCAQIQSVQSHQSPVRQRSQGPYLRILVAFKEQRLGVVGTRKMATFDDVSKRFIPHNQHVLVNNAYPVSVKGEALSVEFQPQEPLRVECEAFLDAIDSRKPPFTGGASGLRVLKVLQEVQHALICNGGIVNLYSEASA